MIIKRLLSLKEQKRVFWALFLDFLNLFSTSSVVGDCKAIVSLTSYGSRIKQAHRAIEAIGRGRLKPKRLILWLSEGDLVDPLPRALKRLKRRGLEIISCKDYRSFKKFFPFVSTQDLNSPLVTADDDLAYPRNWLLDLWEAFLRNPSVISGQRCKFFSFQAGAIAPYDSWPFVDSVSELSNRVFPTSGAGVIYPTSFLLFLSKAGTAFENCCPNADDLWLHVNSVRANIPSCQIRDNPMELVQMPWTWNSALCNDNVLRGGNNKQIATTYTKDDVERILKIRIFSKH